MDYEPRVAKGAAELDRILPGWEQKIDLDELRLESDCNCVLGQLSVDLLPEPFVDTPYLDALDRLQPHEDWRAQCRWAAERGYALLDAEFGGPADYVDLTEAWKRLIRQRLEA